MFLTASIVDAQCICTGSTGKNIGAGIGNQFSITPQLVAIVINLDASNIISIREYYWLTGLCPQFRACHQEQGACHKK
ncbi:hypothetical protein [Barnesiella sp. An55]|uniref:hypothetical protein n=1 Tax=Barnesiella sp. An55 TaxID=1965646 RepID=UPI0013021483|nr:hypothetical protein [Barnesiella sp. An55]